MTQILRRAGAIQALLYHRRAISAALVLFLSLIIRETAVSQQAAVSPIDHRGIIALVKSDSARATLVNLWATWCLPCREEMPALLRLKERYGPAGFRLILVSDDGASAADSLIPATLRKFGVRFPTYVVADSTDEELINGMNPDWSGALPASFLYDSTGALMQTIVGGQSYESLEKALLKILR